MIYKICLPKTFTQTVAALSLLLCCLQSCKSSKEISAQLTYRALGKDSSEPVRIISALHPCVTGEVIPGDSTEQKEYFRKLDSIIKAYRPPGEIHDTISVHDRDSCPELVRDYNLQVDLLDAQDEYIKTLLTQVKVKVPVVHDTVPVLDTRQTYLFINQIEKLEALEKVQTNRISELKSAKKTLWIVIFSLLIPLLISLYFNFRRKLNPLK